jgi:phenylpyruvate tautomerase PptA (4-oxalocrotonate tautomerase family)
MALELAYNRYTNNVKNRNVAISLTRTSTTSAKTVSVIESTSGLTMSFLDSDKTAIVKVNGVEVGTWDLSSGLVTFKDGSVASLDINV